jgi:hypothetical protein
VKKFVIATLLASAASGFMFASGPISAAAAETHSNCVTFDDQGNISNVVPNCSETMSFQGGDPQQMQGANPCNLDPGTITIYFTHQIFHVNVNGAGDIWLTGTQNGTATFTSSDGGANGSGPWASWFGASLNNRNAAFTDTFAMTIKDSAGDTIVNTEVDHTTITATGVVNSFSKPDLTCN